MSLQALLRPRSIAIIGASDNASRIGGVPVELLIRAGFANIYPVNPKSPRVQGLPAYDRIESVPSGVELAIVCVSAEAVLSQLERCHARGIAAAIVYAAGYAETNEAAGRARQAELSAFAQRSGMKIAGPNCMGNANFTDGVFTTFGRSFQPGHPAGATALLTQSGNLCATLYRMGWRAGVAFSHVINTGNEACLEFSEYLEYLAQDEATKCAICYVEGLRDGPAFLRAAAQFRATGKLLAIYKVGVSERGAAASRSHTAALAGDAAAYHASFEAAGVARVQELSELGDLAHLHTLGDKIGGSRCAILSVSGAAGAILADALTVHGGDVPTLPSSVQDELRARIPAFGMVANPVDLTGNLVNANDFVFEAIRLALSPAEVDLLLLYLPGQFLDQALEQVARAAAESRKALIVVDTFASTDRERVLACGVGYFDDLDRAAKAVSRYGAWKQRRMRDATRPPSSVRWPALDAGRGALSELEGKAALARFGVPVVPDLLVREREDARRAAASLGGPVVLKLVSPDVAHKTELGLVRLHLEDGEAVLRAFDELYERARASEGVRIDGVTVEPMLTGGVELLVGATRDPVFGWLLTVGLGGVLTELMQDVSHSLLPIDAAAAEAMLRRLRGFALLDGYRGAAKADVCAAAKAIEAFGDAVLAADARVREIEINPLLVFPQGKGAIAADALVIYEAAAESAQEAT